MIEFQRDAFSVFTGCMEFQYGAKESTAPGDSFVWEPALDGAASRAGSGGAQQLLLARCHAIVRRAGGRRPLFGFLARFIYFFPFFSFLFFRDRATLMKSGHEWAIDSVHVAGGNFSPKCRAYEYGYFESVVREIRRCNWKRRMFSGMCFFFCFSFFFGSRSDYLVGFFERLSCDLKTRGEIACNCKERRKDNVCCAHWKIFWNGFV